MPATCYTTPLYVIDFKSALHFGEAQHFLGPWESCGDFSAGCFGTSADVTYRVLVPELTLDTTEANEHVSDPLHVHETQTFPVLPH